MVGSSMWPPVGSDVRADPDRIWTALEKYSDNPSAFLAVNQGNEFFSAPGADGFVCYRRHGGCWFQFGGPLTSAKERVPLQGAFLEAARASGRRVVGVQLQHADAELFAALGHTVNKVGASYAVELTGYSLRGKRFLRLRNKISRAARAGLEIVETGAADVGEDISSINRRWLRNKGRHVKELSFLIGEVGGPWQEQRRLLLGRIDGEAVGYVSYAPVFGTRPGWLHDLSRRVPDCPPGVMEAINASAIERFRDGGTGWLHFGFTPFTSLDVGHELSTASRATSRIVRFLAEHGESVYPARSQLEYKEKWAPTAVLPEYFAFVGGISPRALWDLLRVTRIV